MSETNVKILGCLDHAVMVKARRQERKDALPVWGCVLKRCFDFVASLVGVLLFSPFMAIIYFYIKREDGGPVIFKQERIGYKGKSFVLYKFRSMTMTAEADGKPALCKKEDKRLTRIGKFLREHHLDELPQLWNVLKGDMSFVGPRPERKYFVDKIISVNPDYELLYCLRPGLFSPATLYNGYTDTMEKMLCRLEYDLYYLMKRSWWFDLKILWNTFCSIVLGKKF